MVKMSYWDSYINIGMGPIPQNKIVECLIINVIDLDVVDL